MPIQEYIRKPTVSQELLGLIGEGKLLCQRCPGYEVSLYVDVDKKVGIKEVRSRLLKIGKQEVVCPKLRKYGMLLGGSDLSHAKDAEYNGDVESVKVLVHCGPNWPAYIAAIRVKDKGFVWYECMLRQGLNVLKGEDEIEETIILSAIPQRKRAEIGVPLAVATGK